MKFAWQIFAINIMFNKRYQILKMIGQGGQGKVFLALDQHHQKIVCIKQLPLPALEEKRGIFLKSKIRHPALVQTIDTFELNKYFYHVMTYIPATHLGDYHNAFNEKKVKKIAFALLSLLVELKKHHLTYNDIKPDNILIDEQDRIYLIDVGSLLEENDMTSQRFGCYGFASPEYIHKQPTTWLGDLYSIAKTLQYIQKHPSLLMNMWLHKSLKTNPNHRFSSIDAAKFHLRYDKLVSIVLGVVLLLLTLVNFPIKEACYFYEIKQCHYLHALWLNPKKEEAYQVFLESHDSVEVLKNISIERLENEVILSQIIDQLVGANMWDKIKEIYQASHLPLGKERLAWMENLSLERVVKDFKFTVPYLLYEKKVEVYPKLWMLLSNYSGEEKQDWHIQMAFQLKDEQKLYECLDIMEGDDFSQAKVYYLLFQLGHYQQGYLHLAKEKLQHHQESGLYQVIEKAIEQWGSES